MSPPSPRSRQRQWFDRLDSPRTWFVVVGLIALVLGTIGFHADHVHGHPLVGSWISCLSWSLGLFTFNNAQPDPIPWTLSIARLLAPATAISGAVYAVRFAMRQFLDDNAIRHARDHTVIFGGGERAGSIALREAGEHRCVIVAPSDDLASVRQLRQRTIRVSSIALHDGLPDPRAAAAMFLNVSVANARQVFVSTGDDEVNLLLAARLREFLSKSIKTDVWSTAEDGGDIRGKMQPQRGPEIAVDIEDLSLAHELSWEMSAHSDGAPAFFNGSTNGVRSFLDTIYRAHPQLAPTPRVTESPRVVIIGDANFAIALAALFATDWSMVVDLPAHVLVQLTLIDFSAEAFAEFEALAALGGWPPFLSIQQSQLRSLEQIEAGSVIIAAIDDVTEAPRLLRTIAATAPGVERWVVTSASPAASFMDLAGLGFRVVDPRDEGSDVAHLRHLAVTGFARSLQSSDRFTRLRENPNDVKAKPWWELEPALRARNIAAVEGWRSALDRLGLTVRRVPRGGARFVPSWIEVDFIAQHLHEAWLDCVVSELGEAEPTFPHALPWASLITTDPDAGIWNVREAHQLPRSLQHLGYEVAYRPSHQVLVQHLAHAQYEGYQKHSTAPLSWADLSTAAIESNLESARAGLIYLWRMGLRLRPTTLPQVRYLDNDDVEYFARYEHARWLCRSREPEWWLPSEDAEDPTHYRYLLGHYDTLSEHERDKDRERIAGLPIILADLGYELIERVTQ